VSQPILPPVNLRIAISRIGFEKHFTVLRVISVDCRSSDELGGLHRAPRAVYTSSGNKLGELPSAERPRARRLKPVGRRLRSFRTCLTSIQVVFHGRVANRRTVRATSATRCLVPEKVRHTRRTPMRDSELRSQQALRRSDRQRPTWSLTVGASFRCLDKSLMSFHLNLLKYFIHLIYMAKFVCHNKKFTG
jgi:hypothetical protein